MHFPERVDVFLQRIERGRSIADAAYEVGVNPTTAYRWRDASAENADRIGEAKAKFKARLLEALVSTIEGDELTDRAPDGALALRTLQVIGGEEWRPKQEVAHSGKPTLVDFFLAQEGGPVGTPQGSGDIPG